MLRPTRTFSLLLLGATAVACGTAPDATGPELPLQAAAAGAPVTHVTGNGHFELADGELRNVAFSAIEKANGSVRGQFQVNNRALGVHAHGHVTCVTVSGNEAWIGGVIDSSSNPAFVGLFGRFRLVDNGQGANAPQDAISLISPTAAPNGDTAFCAAQPAFPALNLLQGNVVIH